MNYCPNCGQKSIPRNIDGVVRRCCENIKCNFIHWNNPVPVVAALVQNNDNYIIARNRSWQKELFSVITGYLEYGEIPQDSVLREVKEELGLSGKITNFLGHHNFIEKNQLIIAYEIKANGKVHCNHELAEIKLLSPSELTTYDFNPLYITESIISVWKTVHDK